MTMQRGFILVLVLWLLVALTLGASALAVWVSRTMAQATVLADERLASLDEFSTLETLKFLFATRPQRVGGLYLEDDAPALIAQWQQNPFRNYRGEWSSSDLRLDDRSFQGVGEALFSLQDEAGLVNINSANRALLEALLAEEGVPAVQREPLLNELRRYTTEALFSPQRGLPAGSTSESGYRGPIYRHALTPGEVIRFPGWRRVAGLEESLFWRDKMGGLEFAGINLNTAPRELLAVHPELGPAAATAIVERREQRPFAFAEQVTSELGFALPQFSFNAEPGDVVRITIWNSHTNNRTRYHLSLTPTQPGGAPWIVEQTYPLYGQAIDAEPARPPDHPLFAESADG